MVRKKPSEDKTEEMPAWTRASQWSIDLVYVVKNLGLPTTLGIAVVVGSWYGVPWYGENIIRPESASRIEATKATTTALATFADAQKLAAENYKLSLSIEDKRQDNEVKFATQLKLISDILNGIDLRLSKIENHK